MASEEEADTFIDGCGVLKDIAVGKGTRIRIRLAEDRQQDVSLFVQDGKLHIYGQYRPVIVTFGQDNHISVHTQVWTIEKEEDQAA